MWAWINNNDSRRIRCDKKTHGLFFIDYSHHEIHEGNHYLYTDSVTLNSTDTTDYLIITPNSPVEIHMIFIMDGSAITQFQLYEYSDRNGTTLQTIGNSNRNSDNLSSLLIYKGTSGGTTDGTLLHKYNGGGSSQISRSPSSVRNDDELILKKNNRYLLRYTSGTNSNLTNLRLSWYEHTPLE